MSAPLEKNGVDSEESRAEREPGAEAALATTAEELERSTRYSADASHQLKSPLTVLRIGLESLLEREGFKREIYEELSTLLHRTRRLTGVIEDLLLLSRMDAGHLQIASTPVNLSQLVDEWLDDLGALPDSPDVKIEKEFPPDLFVAGEKRYMSLIVQNLLENARKYNRLGGRIRVSARRQRQCRRTEDRKHWSSRFRRVKTSSNVFITARVPRPHRVTGSVSTWRANWPDCMAVSCAWCVRKAIGRSSKCAFPPQTVLMQLHEGADLQPVHFRVHGVRFRHR